MSNSLSSCETGIPAEFKRAHVVIVDDDPTNRIMLRSVCEKLGVGLIDEAEDGVAALDLITRFHPDLILLDIQMPGMDGFELISRLRSNPAFGSLSILVQTSLQGTDDRVRCFNMGATDVVSRPLHLTELTVRIRAHLRSAIAARVLFDFRTRIQAHIEITRAFLGAILPTPERVSELTDTYGLSCASFYKPHDEIGGDLWSLRALDEDHLSLVLVDASAHGLAGAINALRVDCLVQEYHDQLHDPGLFLNKLDAAMAKIAFGQLFAGAFALTFNRQSGLICFAGSGIPSPLMLHGKNVIDLKTRGLPLGSGMVSLTTATLIMPSNSSLVLFSDGWSESFPDDPADVLQKAQSSGSALIEALMPESALLDDCTLITLQRR